MIKRSFQKHASPCQQCDCFGRSTGAVLFCRGWRICIHLGKQQYLRGFDWIPKLLVTHCWTCYKSHQNDEPQTVWVVTAHSCRALNLYHHVWKRCSLLPTVYEQVQYPLSYAFFEGLWVLSWSGCSPTGLADPLLWLPTQPSPRRTTGALPFLCLELVRLLCVSLHLPC